MIFMLIAFAVIFVIVLAFSSNEHTTEVRTISPHTGLERIEMHTSVTPSAGQTAARGVVGIILWCIIILGCVALYASLPR